MAIATRDAEQSGLRSGRCLRLAAGLTLLAIAVWAIGIGCMWMNSNWASTTDRSMGVTPRPASGHGSRGV